MRVAGLVAAGGQGLRLGADKPKGFVDVGGRSIVQRAVDGLLSSGVIDDVVVAVPAGYEHVDFASGAVAVRTIVGGVLRQDSVRLMLASIPSDVTHVLVHDAARCLAPPGLVQRVVAALCDGAQAVMPVLPVVDTVAKIDASGDFAGNLPRGELRLVQTPQGFDRVTLEQAHRRADPLWEATDDASVVAAAGGRVQTVVGDLAAMKITTANDLVIAAALLGA